MKYSNNADYLMAAIIYLGTNNFYWGRSPSGMASELGLDRKKLLDMFEEFPGLFRKSTRKKDGEQHYYSLQARHAQREGDETSDPEGNEDIEPLNEAKLNLLINFVMHMSQQERENRRAWWTTGVAALAAVISAVAAVIAAFV